MLAFHGSPASRIWWPGLDVTVAAGVHLVTVDRPGYGGSDPLPGRPIAGWASDVAELTDALGVERFGVVGWSGGAPYAAATAAAMPGPVTGVCLACSNSITYAFGSPPEPDEDDVRILELLAGFGLAEATIRYAEQDAAWAQGLFDDPGSLFDLARIPDGDRWLFDDPDLTAGLFAMVKEGVKQGAIGAATDWVALLAPWGFTLEQVEPAVDVFHGAQDPGVDLAGAERVAASLPNATLTVWPDAGHFGPAKHWDEVLAAVLG